MRSVIRLTPLFLSILKLDHRAAIWTTAVRNLTAGEKVLLMSEQKIRHRLVGIITYCKFSTMNHWKVELVFHWCLIGFFNDILTCAVLTQPYNAFFLDTTHGTLLKFHTCQVFKMESTLLDLDFQKSHTHEIVQSWKPLNKCILIITLYKGRDFEKNIKQARFRTAPVKAEPSHSTSVICRIFAKRQSTLVPPVRL